MIEKAGDKYWCVFVEEIMWAPYEKLEWDKMYPTLCSEDIKTLIFTVVLLALCNSLQWARATSLSRLPDRTHWNTIHLVGISRKSDQPDAEISSWQHTTVTRDRHPCHRQNSYRHANGNRPRLRNHLDRLFFFFHIGVAKSNVNYVLRQILFVTAWCACLKLPFHPAYIHTAPSRGVPVITAALNNIKYIVVRICMWICYKHLNLIEFCREGAFRRVGTYPFA